MMTGFWGLDTVACVLHGRSRPLLLDLNLMWSRQMCGSTDGRGIRNSLMV